jgi:hypothetical protein
MAEHHSGRYEVAAVRWSGTTYTFLVPVEVAPLFCHWKSFISDFGPSSYGSSTEMIWRLLHEWVINDLHKLETEAGDAFRIVCNYYVPAHLTTEQFVEAIRQALRSFSRAVENKEIRALQCKPSIVFSQTYH